MKTVGHRQLRFPRLERVVLLTTVVLLPLLVSAGDFRISFLDQPSILQETCALLESVGIPEETARIFRRLVEWQNQGGNGIDVSKFPANERGAYRFHSFQDFTNRITHAFADSAGKPTFMCFDAAFLLLNSAGLSADLVDKDFESKNIINVTPERDQGPMSQYVLLTATNILCSPEAYRGLTGKARSETERKLGISLHAARRLRPEVTDSDTDLHATFSDFIADVKRDGFVFPSNFKLGLVFYVDVRRRFMKTDHAFVCIPKAGRLIILEKDNSRGPYVRGDFDSERDLAEFASLAERRDTNNLQDVDYGASVVVSLNDRVIGMFRPTAHP